MQIPFYAGRGKYAQRCRIHLLNWKTPIGYKATIHWNLDWTQLTCCGPAWTQTGPPASKRSSLEHNQMHGGEIALEAGMTFHGCFRFVLKAEPEHRCQTADWNYQQHVCQSIEVRGTFLWEKLAAHSWSCKHWLQRGNPSVFCPWLWPLEVTDALPLYSTLLIILWPPNQACRSLLTEMIW